MRRRIFGMLALAAPAAALSACTNEDENKSGTSDGGGSRDSSKTSLDLDAIIVHIGDESVLASDLGLSMDPSGESPVSISQKGTVFHVTIDDETYKKALSELPEELSENAFVNAEISFENGQYTVSRESAPGVGFESSQDFLERFAKEVSEGSADVRLEPSEMDPELTTEEAQSFANVHNDGIANSHLTLGGERIKGITPDEYESFFTIGSENGSFTVVPARDRLYEFAKALPEELNQEAKGGKAVVDAEGKVLKEIDEIQKGVTIGDPEKIADTISEALTKGEFAALEIPGEVTPPDIEKLFRRIEVNKSTKRAKLIENDKVVHDFPVAIGEPRTPSDSGDFSVHTQHKIQDMGCTPDYDYCNRGVKWVTYYNGGEGFHTADWHNNFGNSWSEVSNGCINMRESDAETVYYFAQVGTPVKVF